MRARTFVVSHKSGALWSKKLSFVRVCHETPLITVVFSHERVTVGGEGKD